MSDVIEYKTKCRKLILNYFLNNNNKSYTVKEIKEYLDNQNVSVNISTIYRYLEKLVCENKVRKFTDENGVKASFQYIETGKDCNDHLHLKCISCGKIKHLDCHFMKEIAMHIEADHDFNIDCKNSIIFGQCSECKKLFHV